MTSPEIPNDERAPPITITPPRLIQSKPKRGKPNDYWTRTQVKKNIMDISNDTTRALACCLFVTGCRISEIVGRDEENAKWYYKPVKDRVEQPEKTYTATRQAIKGITPGQFKPQKAGNIKYWIVTGLPVLKQRGVIGENDYKRRAPVSPLDNWAVKEVLRYCKNKTIKGATPIFGFRRKRAYQRLRNAYGKNDVENRQLFCHLFRHTTMNVKYEEDGFDSIELKKFGQYQTLEVLEKYLSESTKNLEAKLVKNYRGAKK